MNDILVEVIDDAKVLIPNPAHQNFSETEEIIPKGAKIVGQQRLINGLRRGQPFTYRLFYTDNNKIIHLNKIKTMANTETTFGADSQVSPTIVKVPLQSRLAKATTMGAIGGAIIGFGYAKYKKHDNNKLMLYTAVGGVMGYVAGLIVENTRKETVITSK